MGKAKHSRRVFFGGVCLLLILRSVVAQIVLSEYLQSHLSDHLSCETLTSGYEQLTL